MKEGACEKRRVERESGVCVVERCVGVAAPEEWNIENLVWRGFFILIGSGKFVLD